MRTVRAFVIRVALLLGAILVVGYLNRPHLGEEPLEVSRTYNEFLIVPVRIHLLKSTRTPAVQTTLSKTEIKRIFRKSARIWHAVGISLLLESVRVEDARPTAAVGKVRLSDANELMPLRPIKGRDPGMFHVYIVGKMGINGLYIDIDGIFVQQAAELTPVEGGTDEALPRVIAHELGHAMNLEHRQDRINLMASGTTGVQLNEAEQKSARDFCSKTNWVLNPSQLLAKANSAGTSKEGRSAMLSLLADLPGDSTVKQTAIGELNR